MLSVGDIAPEIDLLDHQGQRWQLVERRGVPVVVIFTDIWLDCRARNM